MYTRERYWEIQKVRYTYWGKKYTKYEVSFMLITNGERHPIYMTAYTSRYGAINWCRRENQKHNEDLEIRVNEIAVEDNYGIESED